MPPRPARLPIDTIKSKADYVRMMNLQLSTIRQGGVIVRKDFQETLVKGLDLLSLTPADVALGVGVTEGTVIRWLEGQSKPTSVGTAHLYSWLQTQARRGQGQKGQAGPCKCRGCGQWMRPDLQYGYVQRRPAPLAGRCVSCLCLEACSHKRCYLKKGHTGPHRTLAKVDPIQVTYSRKEKRWFLQPVVPCGVGYALQPPTRSFLTKREAEAAKKEGKVEGLTVWDMLSEDD